MAVGQQESGAGKRSNAVSRLFNDHPRSLGMTWASHGAGAAIIGVRLVGAGIACLVHSIVPAWFTQTAGRTVTDIYDDIARRKAGAANPNAWPDYEI
jgi:hypothetical protein